MSSVDLEQGSGAPLAAQPKEEAPKAKDLWSSLLGAVSEGTTRLLLLASGIMVSFVLYGVLQERIITRPYGLTKATEEYFEVSSFLVVANRLVGALIAAVALLLRREPLSRGAQGPPLRSFYLVSLCNVSSTWCQYEALKHVSFPTQTLGKTGKMVPVMILGVLLQGKRYTARDVALNLVITLGCTLFVLTGDVSSSRAGRVHSTWTGVLLMCVYLFVDGLTSTLQERLFRKQGRVQMSTYKQMLWVNLCSASLSLCALLFSGGLGTALSFAGRHPEFINGAGSLSAAAALGQVCIYSTIREFGALAFAGVMVTRQIVSVVVSCLWYVHPLSIGQILAASVVFVTLYILEASRSKGHSKPAEKQEVPLLPLTGKQSDQ